MNKFFLFSAFTTLFIQGCALNPVGQAHQDILASTAIPTQWMMAQANAAETHQQAWWQDFHSASLNALVTQALIHNQDLAAAGFTWQQAILGVDSAAQDRRVSVSSNNSVSISKSLDDGRSSQNHSLNLDASYQVDLWQKLSIAEQTAVWSANASAEDLLATRLSLIGEVVNGWLEVLYLNDQLALNAAEIRYQQQTVNLVQSKLTAGASSRLDLANARQTLTGLENNRITLQSNRQQAQNSLAILLGQPPQTLISDQASLREAGLPEIAAGIPARVLAQRPDLRAAQYRLQTDLGEVAIAERDFYPDISLSGSLSSGSSILREILQNPVAALAGSVSLPFLQYRDHEIALAVSKAQYQGDLASFRQTLYQAFADVENALVALSESEQSARALNAQLTDAKTVERLTQIRYDAGADSLQTLLDAQQARRNVEASVLDNRYQRLTRRVALYLALGGGDKAEALSNSLIEGLPTP